jgi:hypothetical protein
MAEPVEIPITGDGAEPAGGAFLGKAVSGHYPLGEIADSGGHLLLLKLWRGRSPATIGLVFGDRP